MLFSRKGFDNFPFQHPTFHNPGVVLQHPPFEIRRLGWGEFFIVAIVILKEDYGWVRPSTIDARDECLERKLTLEWKLDFGHRGSQGSLRMKVRKEGEAQEDEDDEQEIRS